MSFFTFVLIINENIWRTANFDRFTAIVTPDTTIHTYHQQVDYNMSSET